MHTAEAGTWTSNNLLGQRSLLGIGKWTGELNSRTVRDLRKMKAFGWLGFCGTMKCPLCCGRSALEIIDGAQLLDAQGRANVRPHGARHCNELG